jgi:hypothetical protein
VSGQGGTAAAAGQLAGAGPGPAPGVVKLRLSGTAADIGVLDGLLAALPGVEVLDRSGVYANRRDPGERVYLTVRLTTPDGGGR